MSRSASPLKATIYSWIALNTNELSWIVLLTGLAILVGVFVSP